MDKTSLKEAEKLALKATREEQKLLKKVTEFELQNAEFAKFLKTQNEMQRKVTQMWDDVKNALVQAGYFDVIENENFRVSVSKVSGIKVVDLDKLPDEFTHTVKVAKADEIKKHYELYGELPDGVVDSSYYRLNKKVK
jgi:hypothetical protein